MQGQKEPASRQQHTLSRSLLLHRHPVLTPVVLLSSSLVLGIASFFADTLFPVLALIGVPVGTLTTLCLSIAFILGVAGVLIGIISILERVDRYCSTTTLPTAMFPRLKEQSYANRN